MTKKIAVDFDGVIHKYSKGFQEGKPYDSSIDGAKESLARLVKQGYKIIIHTTRVNPEVENQDRADKQNDMIREWLRTHGFELNIHWHDITSQKPLADAYIDDRAIRFTNWTDIEKYFI